MSAERPRWRQPAARPFRRACAADPSPGRRPTGAGMPRRRAGWRGKDAPPSRRPPDRARSGRAGGHDAAPPVRRR
ncbi:hypothetical protein CRT60_18355 [Azospirillum palustre]|uniref:Uncharacterized protein n=1 Tax=Azospirillum palustre TaxID=2044885 RepID=A0A2B8BC48_9PROT|nr:hypothetical protein CRT60_18355 [Azospirillum palustre]